MFGIGGQELIIILVLALILLGPKKLPDIAKSLGKALGEFQRASDDLKKEIDLSSQVPAEEPSQKKSDDTETAQDNMEPPDNARTPQEENLDTKTANHASPYNPDEIEE
ncbi:MAG TPA: twin-arginine translocase TatA/TatE family subunit [Deltaproteobacteria bacterium]|nr:twin-arginine translocase TatA/TatE family subunit [Deltaproteobacteria bacterium]